MKTNFIYTATYIVCLFNSLVAQTNDSIKVDSHSKMTRPTLFSNLGDSFQTPDAMAVDKNGDLYVSVPNFVKHEQYGGKICKFNKLNQPEPWYDSLPKHIDTKTTFPMGMAFGQDGNLYVADNQSSTGKLRESRLIRIVIENGKPIKSEVVVKGFNIANGVRSYKNKIYVSDSYFSVKDTADQSGIYCFAIEEFKNGPIELMPNPLDSHILCRFTTKTFEGNHDQGGVDGLTIDKYGNLYAGNFGDGVISKIELTPEGKVKSQKIIVDSDKLQCCDGMYYYEKTNSIYIANFYNNSIEVLNLNKKTLSTLWVNDESNGADGLLDQPCDPIIYNGKLLVVNFDSFLSKKNKDIDKFHTISCFELHK
jgi:DNA-binding beta-propeller fold protein YncE